MANSGSFNVLTSNGYISGTVTWQEQNVNNANNTSDVYVEMRLSRTNTGYDTSGSGSFTVTVNGTNVTASTSFDLTYNSNTLMVSGTVTGIAHNSDGTKQITISWSGSSNVFTVNNGSGTATLSTIPRASTLVNSPSFTAGNNVVVNINQYDSSFSTHLQIRVLKSDGVTYDLIDDQYFTGTSWGSSWDVNKNGQIYNDLAQRASCQSWYRIITLDAGGNQVGYNDYYGTCSAASPTTANLGTFNIGTKPSISLNPAFSAMTHKLEWSWVNYNTTIATGIQGTSYTWDQTTTDTSINDTFANGMYKQIPSKASTWGTLKCTTYYNGVQVQSPVSVQNIYGNVIYSNPTAPGLAYLDTNTTTTTVTANNQYIVQGQSTLRVKVPGANQSAGVNFATISKYVATFNGVSVTVTSWTAGTDIVFDFGSVNVSSNQNATVVVTDSRGFTTTVTISVNIIPYQPPVINATAIRGSGFTSTVTITLQNTSSMSSINPGGAGEKNSLKAANCTWAYGQVGQGLGAATAISGITVTMPNYSAPGFTQTMSQLSAYTVQINITDQLTSNSITLTVPVSTPIMFIDKVMKAIGIGKFPRSGYSLDAAGDISTDTQFWEGGTKLIDKYLPAGLIQINAGTSVPSGWLACAGGNVSRTTYSRLFNAIGTTYGVGDGSTTFGLPSIVGRVPVGQYSGDTDFANLGNTGGEKTHTLTTAEMPIHSHQVTTNSGLYFEGGSSGYPGGSTGYATQASTLNTGNAGSGNAHNNMPPYIVVQYVIKT